MIDTRVISSSVMACPVCGSESNASEVMHMPAYPLTELYTSECPTQDYSSTTTLDQTFCYSSECSHGYLREIVSPEFLYAKDNYNTVTTLSQGSLISINNFVSFISKNPSRQGVYSIDIGGNDSNLLDKIGRAKGCIIDPSASSDSSNFACINQFFENVNPDRFTFHQSVDIVSSHTLEHIKNPHAFFEFINKIKNVSDLYIQFPCLELMVSSSRYDLIHHQHLHYFTLRSISRLAEDHGFIVDSYEYDVDHYGTLRVHLTKGLRGHKAGSLFRSPDFQLNASTISAEYLRFVLVSSEQSFRISKLHELYCYGASLMLPIVFYYYPHLTESCLGIFDIDKNKRSLWYANVPIPILHDNQSDLSDKSIFVSAVATRSACRKIVKNLVDRNPMHMFIPFDKF